MSRLRKPYDLPERFAGRKRANEAVCSETEPGAQRVTIYFIPTAPSRPAV